MKRLPPDKNRICGVGECDRRAKARGFCMKHYRRFMDNGDPLITRVGNKSHGMTGTPEYRTWNNMKSRCYSKSRPDYRFYGGRGIKVCDRWRKSFENFYADMGNRPKGMTLDRINVDGDYSPDNCKWASWSDQFYNRRSTHKISHNGKKYTATALALELGLNEKCIRDRLASGMELEDAISMKNQAKKYEWMAEDVMKLYNNGMSKLAITRELNISKGLVYKIIKLNGDRKPI